MNSLYLFSLNIAIMLTLIGLVYKFPSLQDYFLYIGCFSCFFLFFLNRKVIFTEHLKFRVIRNLFNFLQLFTKKNAYVLIDDLFEEDAECIDAYSLFLYMQERGIPSYYVVWKNNYFYKKLKQENKLKNVIVVKKKFGTDLLRVGFFPLLRTKIIVSAFLNWGNFTQDRSMIQKWISKNKYITHVYLDHGVVFFKKDVLSGYTHQYFDKLIVSNDIEKELYQNRAAWLEQDVIKGGLCRWDLLRKEPHSQKNIFVFFTFRKTFHKCKNYKEFDYYKNIISLFNNKKLIALLEAYNIKLIYGVHHALYNQVGLDWMINSDCIEIANVQNISQYIKNTDLFITDYSSIVFDFMFLDIPVIFYKLDFLDVKLHQVDKLSMEEFSSCIPFIYNCVDTEELLIDKIQHYISNDFVLENEFIKSNNKFFYMKNNISEHVFEELEKL